MPLEIESFPHWGEHCDNDPRQSHVTTLLLAIVALVVTACLVTGLNAL